MQNLSAYLRYKGHQLYLEDCSLTKIAREVGTPVYVISKAQLLQQSSILKRSLKGLDHQICFAVKSSSNISILKLLSHDGVGMDIVSGGELYRCLQAGIKGRNIIFSGVGKTREEIEDAIDYLDEGIYSFHIESIAELKLLENIAKQKRKKVRVSFRFNPDVNAKTHPYISTGLKRNKFGVVEKDLLEAVALVKAMKHVRLHGIGCHIGSQIIKTSPFRDAYKKLATAILKSEDILGRQLEFADLGGGIGIPYDLNDRPFNILDYSKAVHQIFGKKSQFKGRLKILIEPGRFISGNSTVLLGEVLLRKHTPAKEFVVTNIGMNDLIRPALYQGHHEVFSLDKKKQTGPKIKTDVVGPVCETGDFICRDRPIPKSWDQGDLIAVASAGAYCSTMASRYNSRGIAPEVLVDGSSYSIIREREDYRTLIEKEVF